jgi:hypothetical protein
MKLPDFKTEKEEIRFWERHSIGDYWTLNWGLLGGSFRIQ